MYVHDHVPTDGNSSPSFHGPAVPVIVIHDPPTKQEKLNSKSHISIKWIFYCWVIHSNYIVNNSSLTYQQNRVSYLSYK